MDKKRKNNLITLMLKYVKKYWYFAILAPLFMMLEVGMDYLLNYLMSLMIDNGIGESVETVNTELIVQYGIQMLVVVLIGVICGVLAGVFTQLATFNAINDLRVDTFNKIMDLSYNQSDKFSTGSLSVRVTNDIDQIQRMIMMSLRMVIRQISMFIIGIIFTLAIDVRFGYVLLVALPLEVLIMVIALKKGTPYFSKMQQKIDNVNTVVHENLSGARVVKAFSKENHEYKRFVRVNDDYADVMLKVQKMLALLMPLLMIVIYFAKVVVYGIGGYSAFNAGSNGPDLEIGQINNAISNIQMICFSLMMFGMFAMQITRAIASSKRIIEVLETEDEIIDGNFDITKLKEKGTLEFSNVSFSYPDCKGYALENINFKIKQGETICIVGGTGSGKSTLVNLITRFYDINKGSIKVDGIDIKEFKQKDLRNKVTICLQKSELFAGTIKENIKWGKNDATDEEINEAIEISQAKEFIDTRPNKLDEWVEEKGSSLSGGQKQRLSIARAIIKKPEILIFDDSTSALDLVTEAKLYKAMKEKINDVTKIVVAQRIATAKNADKIIVLDGGKIVDFDTHENLMKNCLIYKDIYNSQLKQGGMFDGE